MKTLLLTALFGLTAALTATTAQASTAVWQPTVTANTVVLKNGIPWPPTGGGGNGNLQLAKNGIPWPPTGSGKLA